MLANTKNGLPNARLYVCPYDFFCKASFPKSIKAKHPFAFLSSLHGMASDFISIAGCEPCELYVMVLQCPFPPLFGRPSMAELSGLVRPTRANFHKYQYLNYLQDHSAKFT